MLTISNCITAAQQHIADFKIVAPESAAAFWTAKTAYKYASMAVGAAQNPFNEEMVAKATQLAREADELMQKAIAAQLDAAGF